MKLAEIVKIGFQAILSVGKLLVAAAACLQKLITLSLLVCILCLGIDINN